MKAVMFSALVVLLTAGLAFANTEAGPRGGKLLENGEPRAEVLIEENRVISIAFYDQAKKQVSPGEHVITGTAEAPTGKSKLVFEKKGELLVSTTPLPEGEGYNVVLQVKENAASKPQNFRVKYNMHVCGECSHPEYACTCDH